MLSLIVNAPCDILNSLSMFEYAPEVGIAGFALIFSVNEFVTNIPYGSLTLTLIEYESAALMGGVP